MSGKLKLDTRTASQYFRLEISGKLSILSVLSLSGAVIVEVSAKAWSITIPTTNKLGVTLGPLSLYAWGSIRSDGYFDINLSGGIDLTWQGNGVKGSVDLSVKFDPADNGQATSAPRSAAASRPGSSASSCSA